MIRIVQCLCGPARHCIVGIAYLEGMSATAVDGSGDVVLSPDTAALWFRSVVEEMLKLRSINPWCHLCQSRTWFYEDMPTKFQTLGEAESSLRDIEFENHRTRQMIDSVRARARKN